MKIFLIGSLPDDDGSASSEAEIFRATMRELGAQLAQAGHELLVCSPYEGSMDREIVIGAGTVNSPPRIEMHFPRTTENAAAVDALAEKAGVVLSPFFHPADPSDDERAIRYGWLLSQLTALDKADAVIAVGGNRIGSASMLLRVAEGRRTRVLPFAHFGGAASASLDRQRFTLSDRIGPDLVEWLARPTAMTSVMDALDKLVTRDADTVQVAGPERFFLSYPRARAAEADAVENILRRRSFDVYRDDQHFDPNADLPQAIREAISRSTIFVALWCQEYASSPWCYDELEFAVERRANATMKIWLLQLDKTRMVLPKARKIITHAATSRAELNGTLLKLIEGISKSD